LLRGDSLEAAILATVAYFDVFACAPYPREIHRFLMGKRATRREVEDALATSPELQRMIGGRDGCFYLAGKDHLELRRRRFQRHSDLLWPQAKRIARVIEASGLASCGMVTGSLAADNADEAADIDFLFTYPADRTWTSYAAVRLVAKLPMLGLRQLCPNYVLSEARLEIQPQNLFTAWEIAKSVPMFGFEVYERFVRANSWVLRYLPNGLPDVGPAPPDRPTAAASRLLRSKPYQWLESAEQRRKYSTDRRDVGVDMHDRAKKGSMDRHSPTRSYHALSELRYRMEHLGLSGHPVYPELAPATAPLAAEMNRWGPEPILADRTDHASPQNGAVKRTNGVTAHTT
jgi:hypothetical protein